jgi:hypothetical protein
MRKLMLCAALLAASPALTEENYRPPFATMAGYFYEKDQLCATRIYDHQIAYMSSYRNEYSGDPDDRATFDREFTYGQIVAWNSYAKTGKTRFCETSVQLDQALSTKPH